MVEYGTLSPANFVILIRVEGLVSNSFSCTFDVYIGHISCAIYYPPLLRCSRHLPYFEWRRDAHVILFQRVVQRGRDAQEISPVFTNSTWGVTQTSMYACMVFFEHVHVQLCTRMEDG
jgi:hypothetical protein